MMCRLLLFHVFLLLPVPISSGVWVRQWPTETHKLVGRSIEFHCRIESDQEQVQDCNPFWYIPDPATSIPVKNIKHEGLYEGRFTIGHHADTSTSLNITSLQMNDTNTYYCKMICNINGKVFRKSGNGSSLHVLEEDREDYGLQEMNECDEQLPMHLYVYLICKAGATAAGILLGVLCTRKYSSFLVCSESL